MKAEDVSNKLLEKTTLASSSVDYTMLEMFGKVCIALALILILITILTSITKKIQKSGSGNATDLQVMQVVHLSPKQKITVCEFEGQRLLLGVTPNQINVLDSVAIDNESKDFKECLDKS